MKKVVILARAGDAAVSVETLRSLGVVHVEHQRPPAGKEINGIQEDIVLLETALSILSEDITQQPSGRPLPNLSGWRQTAGHIVDCRKRLDQLGEYSRGLVSQISLWQEWGDFEPKAVEELAAKNIYLRFYQIPVKEIKNLDARAKTKIIKTKGGIANCVIVSEGRIELGYKETALPKTSLTKMRSRLKEDHRAMRSIKEELSKFSAYQKEILAIKDSLIKELEFQQALCGMGADRSLVYLTGYLPYDALEVLRRTAKQEKWGLLIMDPALQDNVPVLLRNPRWVSLISPVYKLLEVLPGYRELDISLPFLIFFSIFFGILIGDAGYGLVYLVITFYMQKKFGRRFKEYSLFYFFYLLSSCTVVWGLLTGTFFGQAWVLAAGYKPLAPALNDPHDMQVFCFFLGALHLSIAHGWRAFLKLPSLAALADTGWVCVLWASFFAARLLILSDPFPVFAKWLIVSGLILVVFFTNPQKNPLRTIGEGLGALALSLMNNFTDVVSYLRLFAVGLAGVAIADAFNGMAAMVGSGNILLFLAGAAIAIVGHALGVALGPVSVLVHGVRLNVLEFSGHANISWSGVKYRPLKS